MQFTKTLPLFLATITLSVAGASQKGLRGFPASLEEEERRNLSSRESNAKLQEYEDAAFMSRMAYFVDKYHPDDSKKTPNCLDPDDKKLSYCKFKEDGVDAVVIAHYHDKCFVSFRGTKNLDSFKEDSLAAWVADSEQNIGSARSMDADTRCEVRAGFRNAYQVGKFIESNLPDCKKKCGSEDCPVVLTGHSQGGAKAVVESTWRSRKTLYNDPTVITFGAPPAVTTYDECLACINPSKHYRVVTSTSFENYIISDPIADQSKTKTTIDLGPFIKPRYTVFEDKLTEDLFHMGNVILLNEEAEDGTYEIASGVGDMRLRDPTYPPLELGNQNYKKGQLHHIETYLGNLREANEWQFGAKVQYGLIEGHACSQDWQCYADMLCRTEWVTDATDSEKLQQIQKQKLGAQFGVCYRKPSLLVGSVDYGRGAGYYIDLKYQNTDSDGLKIRVLNPNTRKVVKRGCQEATGQNIISIADETLSGSVEFQLGKGDCNSVNSEVLSDSTADFEILSSNTIVLGHGRSDKILDHYGQITATDQNWKPPTPTQSPTQSPTGSQSPTETPLNIAYTKAPKNVASVVLDVRYPMGYNIYLDYKLPGSVRKRFDDLFVRIVNPSNQAVLVCTKADETNSFNLYGDSLIGAVWFQLGSGSCKNFDMLSNDVIDFAPNSDNASIIATFKD